ncbi:hypothetical protein [Streptomyces lacrimifluminis]|nr:hypothetical protein [Streptomyces lacrimifluminis]
MYPSDFRDTSAEVRITLLAALCWSRQAEITDALVELLVALVHKINARAERRVPSDRVISGAPVRGSRKAAPVQPLIFAAGHQQAVVRESVRQQER